MTDFLAHLSDDGRKQTVKEHLEGTAKLCAGFALQFGAKAHGFFAGSLHDIGKNTRDFLKRLFGGPRVDHSTAGAYECWRNNAAGEAIAIAGHHGGLPDFGNYRTDQSGDPTFCGRMKKAEAKAIPDYSSWDGVLPPIPPPPPQASKPLPFSFWTRMLYSCLVDADFLDTEAFMKGFSPRESEYDSFETLLQKLSVYVAPWKNPQTKINRLRNGIYDSCLSAGAEARGLYTLTVPTGGGKTVASLAFALRQAVTHGMQRIVYVIPYTSIIDQNARVFKAILGEKNVLEHHSSLCYELSENASPAEYKKALATENWDAPVVVTTAVQFFESVYANRSSKCRKLHNLANSVLIFDEAQMLPPEQLLPCTAAIASFVSDFNATAVLCTATQPALNDLIARFAPALKSREICPDSERLFEAFRRVSFRRAGMLNADGLSKTLEKHRQVLCIVNSRAFAQEVFSKLPPKGRYHLSTLMYPAHRESVLKEIREKLSAGEICRVVSTSLIEAGVDVDFPAVFRETAGLDSILQAAGRCNRENRRSAAESTVTLFEGGSTPPLFRMNVRATAEALGKEGNPADPQAVSRYFRALRSLMGESMDKSGVIDSFNKGIAGCALPFKTVADRFHMIGDNTKTVYIPLGEGKQWIDALLSGEPSRQTYRQAGRFGVSVYEQHFKRLAEAGDIEPLDGESGVLVNLSLYSIEMGLSLQADTGKANFI